MTPRLSLLCVTRAERYARPFLADLAVVGARLGAEVVCAADGAEAVERLQRLGLPVRVVPVISKGYLESVLDEAVAACTGDYVLRVDDDERLGPGMVTWLAAGGYAAHDHWKFPRMHLWGDTMTWIVTPHLWPDWQTRLSVKAKSGGRPAVHQGSPFGGGEEAPDDVYLEHHKFLVKPAEVRRRIAQGYDRFSPGFGTGDMKPFSLPEEVYDRVVFVDRISGDRWEGPLCPPS